MTRHPFPLETILSPRRLTVVMTSVIAAVVFVVLAVTKWTEGEQIAGIVSTVCGVLAVGTAVVPLLSRPNTDGDGPRWQLSRTGRVRAGHGSTAITGVSTSASTPPDSLDLSLTGKVRVGDDSIAVTGVHAVNAGALGSAAAAPGRTPSVTASRDVGVHLEAQRSGQVQAGDHSTNVTGAVGSLFINTPGDAPRPHHTDYLVRVRQLRPEALQEREPELLELANFCTRDDGPGYVWWQAGPWAGKTALMAHFVDHPPDAVRIVSFFIIARDASEADSEAFLERVIPQLAEIAELPVPANIAGNQKRDYFWKLVEEADATCVARGERLVLLVDGLDEDRSMTGSETGRSIASILPKQAGRSFRVITAGRQNPPIPADVQADHPLREPAVVRQLDPSPYGLAIKAQAELQLRAHLDDGGLQHEVLAFVTVARGGLTAPDLAELCGETVPRVRNVLNSHSGRAYQLRDQVWFPAQEVMLAHDKLRDAAEEGISRVERAEKLAALARWADGYCDRAWPGNSPEYLLTGFYRILIEAGDTGRLVSHVADLNRLELLRSMTGGDAMGLGQIVASIEQARTDPANVRLTVRLGLVRDHLSDRNGNLPEEVPEVWVRLGEPRRAEALAESSMNPNERAEALGRLVQPLIECGYSDRVGRIVEKACAAAILADGEGWSDSRLDLAERLYATGFRDESVDLLRRVCEFDQGDASKTDIVARDLLDLAAPNYAADLHPTLAEILALKPEAIDRSGAVNQIVTARARRRDPRLATGLVTTIIAEAASIPDAQDRLDAFYALADSALATGDQATAIDLLSQSTHLARTLPNIWHRIDELDNAAILASKLGDPQTARSLALEARDLIDAANESGAGSQQHTALGWLAHSLAGANDTDEALRTVDRITDLDQRHVLLGQVAEALARAGNVDAANKFLSTLPDTIDATDILLALADHHASAGRFRPAEEALAAVTDPRRRAHALGSIALYAVRQKDTERALASAVEAENTARTIVPTYEATRVLRALGLARHQLGDPVGARATLAGALHEARRATRSQITPEWGPLCQIADALAKTGDLEQAHAVADEVLTAVVEGLRSGRFPHHELNSVVQGLSPIDQSLHHRIIDVLTSTLPLVRDASTESLTYIASAARQHLNPAAAKGILDLAIERLASSRDKDQATGCITVAESSMHLGRAEQAQEHLAAALEIADTSLPRTRRSILERALRRLGALDDGSLYEIILSHAEPSDVEYLRESLARPLGELGRLDDARRHRDLLTDDARRAFTERLVVGLANGGYCAEVLAEFQLAGDVEARVQLVPAAVRAHLARGEFIDVMRLVTTTPMIPSLRVALPDLLEHCDTNQANTVVSIAAAHGPISTIVDHLAEGLPEILTANGDMIHEIYQVDAVSAI